MINNSRWVAYATAGVATAIAGATSAEATTIHYSGPINHAFSGISFLTFALDNGADLGFGHIPGRAIFRVEPFNGFNTGAGDTYGLYGYLLGSQLTSLFPGRPLVAVVTLRRIARTLIGLLRARGSSGLDSMAAVASNTVGLE